MLSNNIIIFALSNHNKYIMPQKLISAQAILAEKGYVMPKFDTDGFNNAVVEFFRAHGPEVRLQITPVRFINFDWLPKQGWKAFFSEKDWECIINDENNSFDYWKFQDTIRAVSGNPQIFVDEPFVKNAVAMLQIMGGFVVKKSKKKYYISLI
jgi:hypothetical protein